MVIRSAGSVQSDEVVRADVCVIGSGAAGITIARCLDGTDTNVLLLEAGGLRRDCSAEDESFRVENIGLQPNDEIESRGRWFGGSTNLWFGRIALPDPIDFETRAWVDNSGWPVSLDTLKQWYPVAADILGVRHLDRFDVSTWPSNETTRVFGEAVTTELRTFFWADAQNMAEAARPILERSRNVVTMTDAAVQEIVLNDNSVVSALRVVGPGGVTFNVVASEFVLAAGGIENPRLLLASTSSHSNGVGNEHDTVGRYLMDHPRGEGSGKVGLKGLTDKQRQLMSMLDERSDGPYGTTQLRVVFPQAMQRREELLNHSLHGYVLSDEHSCAGFASYKRVRERLGLRRTGRPLHLLNDLASMSRDAPALARLLVGKAPATQFVVVDQMEQEPDPESRITVNHRDRDRFGLPRVRSDWRVGESTIRSQRRMHEIFRDALAAEGVPFESRVLDGEDVRILDMKHPSGTTRMSASPRKGVVDADLRVHGVDNLSIVGSSTFPTAGNFNPTFLIVAMAARLAARLQVSEQIRVSVSR